MSQRLAAESERHTKAAISRSLEQNHQHFNQVREKLEKWADDMVLIAEKALKNTKEQAWEEWLIYLLKGVEETAVWTIAKIGAIRALSDHTREHVRLKAPKIYSHELVNLIFELPYCRIHDLSEAGIAKRQAAPNYLKELVSIGVLTENPIGREKLFIHPKLMQLLTLEGNTFTPYP